MLQRYSGEAPWRRTRRMVSVAQPAAGADFSLTVPTGVLWELVSLIGLLTTSAAVATRRPRLTVSDGNTVGVRISGNTNATASQAVSYGWAQDVANVSVGTDGTTAIPHLALEPGWVVAVSTIALDAADQWSAVAAHIIETTYRRGQEQAADLGAQVIELVLGSAG